ncbi:ABC transporter permease [Rhodococcus rhodnii]|nr:ABC transporter permease [Rhodococcus rhodnii]TXG92349.1 ABC transporter permease [Rhodococcus rhodnii]
MRDRTLIVSAAVLAVIVGYAVLVPLVSGGSGPSVDFGSARLAPGPDHWFGTDGAGRDLFVRTAEGLRISLIVAAVCALASTVIGTLVGVASAALGGTVDRIVMRCVDGVNALPHLLLGIAIVAFYPGNLLAIIASIALTHWTQVARIARAEVLALRDSEVVAAARLAGATPWQIVRLHLVPAAGSQAVVAVVMLLPHAIWHESTLSFLGLGLPPDRPSLGTLLDEARSSLLLGGWWTLAFPAGALVVTTLAVAGLGSAARRVVAPLERERIPS